MSLSSGQSGSWKHTQMDAPIKPRYTYVDQQITQLEEGIRDAFMTPLNELMWAENDELTTADVAALNQAIVEAFLPIMRAYESSHAVSEALDASLILIQNCMWCGMNLPFMHTPLDHQMAVYENVHSVFNRVCYARLRTEMIMANHNCEIIQRNWRRCITDPEHPACRRRLELDFSDLKHMCV
jgi:hypothetical protein